MNAPRRAEQSVVTVIFLKHSYTLFWHLDALTATITNTNTITITNNTVIEL